MACALVGGEDVDAELEALQLEIEKTNKALAEVEAKLEEAGIRPHHIEGKTTGWIALDYESVIVHVFSRQEREFYGLDKMWADAPAVNLDEILVEAMGD